MKTLASLGILGLAFSLSCMPAYLDTVAPSDATFDVTCVASCGKGGLDAGLLIEASFSGGTRQYALCCEHRAALMAQLQTIEDLWCDGLNVPDKTIGGLTVGVVVSEITGARGATIDDGEGFVAFNCDAWLGQLITKLKQTTCCQPAAPAAHHGADRSAPGLWWEAAGQFGPARGLQIGATNGPPCRAVLTIDRIRTKGSIQG